MLSLAAQFITPVLRIGVAEPIHCRQSIQGAADRVVLEVDGVADLVQQLLGALLLHRLPPSI